MTLTILSVSYPLAPIGPDAVGGAEQILSRIDCALTRAGHCSLVVACEGSQPAGGLIPIGAFSGALTDEVREAARAKTLEAIQFALCRYKVDVIHLHGVDFASYLPETDVPVIVTLHLPPSWYPARIFDDKPGLWMHCVSAAQRQACPPAARLLPDIPNGVPIPDPPAHDKKGFALSLGRICPEKGFHLAAEAAKRAEVPFVLAGEVFGYDAHREYFQDKLLPQLNDEAVYIGPVGGVQKRTLLAGAKCVLIPSMVPETSSLVALEAMAAGTPVVAFPAGALAGIVQDGHTGFLVNDVDEMAEAIGRTSKLSSENCRKYVAENFSLDRMTERYLEVYSALAKARPKVSTPQSYEIQLVRNAAGLAELVPEWRQLFESSSDTTPFQSPDWLQPWWECFASGTLTTIAIRHAGALVGLAPLYIEGRTVRFLGASISDYGDLLAAAGWEQTIADAVVAALCSLESEWSLCDFDELPPSSPLLVARTPAKYPVTLQDASVCPSVDLHGFRLPAKQRKSLHTSQNRLQRELPEAQFETLGDDETDTFVEAFIRLHEARWKERAGTGVLADTAVQRFHRTAIPRLHREGVARLHVLRSRDRILSALYCLAKGCTLYSYLGGLDPSVERLGPGSLLIDYAMEQARLEGLTMIDFLRGAEEYKYRWGAVDRRNRRLQIRND